MLEALAVLCNQHAHPVRWGAVPTAGDQVSLAAAANASRRR